MTDYKIKNLYVDGIKREMDVALTDGLSPANKVAFAGFYAGFRTAERLAKIEVLEELEERSRRCYMAQSVFDEISAMLKELKESNK